MMHNSHVVVMQLPITCCPSLEPSESSQQFKQMNDQLNIKSDADSLLSWLSHFESDAHKHTCSLRGIHCPTD